MSISIVYHILYQVVYYIWTILIRQPIFSFFDFFYYHFMTEIRRDLPIFLSTDVTPNTVYRNLYTYILPHLFRKKIGAKCKIFIE